MIKAEQPQPTEVEMRRYVVNDIALKTFNIAQQILIDAGRRKVNHAIGEDEVKILANRGTPWRRNPARATAIEVTLGTSRMVISKTVSEQEATYTVWEGGLPDKSERQYALSMGVGPGQPAVQSRNIV